MSHAPEDCHHCKGLARIANDDIDALQRTIAQRFDRILVVSCRQTLSYSQQGFFPGFDHYQESNPSDHYIIQYESLFRTRLCQPFSLLLLDEVRNLADCVTSIKTNPGTRLVDNFEQLKRFVGAAELTIAIDADLECDDMVARLTDAFGQECLAPWEIEVHRYTCPLNALHRSLRLVSNEQQFVGSINTLIEANQRVALLCRTKRLAEVYAVNCSRFNSCITVITSETPKKEIEKFVDADSFLRGTVLLVATARLTCGTDISLPFTVFVDFRGRSGCSARNIGQMIGRLRKLANPNAQIDVLVEPDLEETRVPVEEKARNYLEFRGHIKEKYRDILDRDLGFQNKEVYWTPQGITKLFMARLKEDWQNKLYALREMAHHKHWTILDERQDVAEASQDLADARSVLQFLKDEELKELFAFVTTQEVIASQEDEIALRKKLAVLSVLNRFTAPLSFEDFKFAMTHDTAIANFALLATSRQWEDSTQVRNDVLQLKDGKRIWLEQTSSFYLVQVALMKEALTLLGVPRPNALGTLIQEQSFLDHEQKLLELTRLCAVAGHRFDSYRKLNEEKKGHAAVSAMRRELRHVWGTGLDTKSRRRKDEGAVFEYAVNEDVKRLAKLSRHAEHLIALQREMARPRKFQKT